MEVSINVDVLAIRSEDGRDYKIQIIDGRLVSSGDLVPDEAAKQFFNQVGIQVLTWIRRNSH